MRITKIIMSLVEVCVGVIFLLNSASDIQFGFGLILVSVGINSLLASI